MSLQVRHASSWIETRQRERQLSPGSCEQPVFLPSMVTMVGRAQSNPLGNDFESPELRVVPHAEPGLISMLTVGISLVRGLGPGIPRAPTLNRRSRLRTEQMP